jgi:uncharacterized delta-60 repeat protein
MQHFTSKLVRLASPLMLAFVLVAQALQLKAASPVSDGYNTNVDGIVTATIVQPDGSLLIAGRYGSVTVGTATDVVGPAYLTRVKPDGTPDPTFAPGFGPTSPAGAASITAMALQADGSVIVIGDFTSSGGEPHNHIARIRPNGTVDSSFVTGLDLLIGTNATTTSRDFRMSSVLVQPDGKIVVTGNFNTVTVGSAKSTVGNIVRLNADGSIDTSFDIFADNIVMKALYRYDNSLLIGGGFTKLDHGPIKSSSPTRNRMARILADGSIDASFNPNFDNRVNTFITTTDGTILVAGLFSTLQPSNEATAINSRLVARLKPDGTYASGYLVNIDGEVLTLAMQQDGKILMGGYFTTIMYGSPSSTSYQSYLVRLNPNGSPDSTFYSGLNYAVTSISVQTDGKIIAGGYFDKVTPSGESFNITANHIARFYPDGSMDRDFISARLGGVTFSIPLSDGKVLIGGSFLNIGGVTRTYIAKISATGEVDSSFAPVLDGALISAYVMSDGRILIGGSFGTVNGVTQRYVALLKADGSLDASFAPVLNGAVRAFGVQSDGKLIIGGDFTMVADQTRGYIARVSMDGTVDTSYDPRASSTVRVIRMQSDGTALIGGAFSYLTKDGGDKTVSRYYIARINSDGSVADSPNLAFNNEIYDIQPQSDGTYYVGGGFSAMGVLKADKTIAYLYGIARVKADWTVDPEFAPYVGGSVGLIRVMNDGRILIVGSFSTVVDKTRYYIARLNKDATLDTTYDPYPNSTVSTIAYMSSTDSALLGGSFSSFTPNGYLYTTTVNGVTTTTGTVPTVNASGLAMINTDGTVSSSFKVNPPSSNSGSITTLTRMVDGRIVAGGSFSSIGGSTTKNLSRIYPDGHFDLGFAAAPNGAVNAVANWPMRDDLVDTTGAYAWLSGDGQTSKIDYKTIDQIVGTVNCAVFKSDGSVVIGGNFYMKANTSFKNLVHLGTDGKLDTTFTPNPDAPVAALVLTSDGKYLVGGSYVTIAKGSPSYFTRLNADGSIDDTMKTHPNGAVYTIAPNTDGSVIIGGAFTGIYDTAGTATTTRSYIAKMAKDGTFDTSFTPTPDGQINQVLIQSDGNILIIGGFYGITPTGSTSSTTRYYIARLKSDGKLDTDYNPNPDGTIYRMALDSSGKLYVGGAMKHFKPNSTTTSIYRPGLARINTDGTVDEAFNVVPNNSITCLALKSDGSLVVGGNFTVINNVNRTVMALISNTGALLGTGNFLPDPTTSPNTILVDSAGGLFIGGQFSNHHIDPVMMVGGEFTTNSDSSTPYLARLFIDGKPDTAFNQYPDKKVHAVLRRKDKSFIIGGEFSTVGGADTPYIALLDTDKDPNGVPISDLKARKFSTVDGRVLALAMLPDGRILIGGSFNSAGGVGHARLAMLKSDGTLDTSFTADADGDVTSILATPTRIYVAGSFSRVGTVGAKNFAVVGLDGKTVGFPDLALDGAVSSIGVDGSGNVSLVGTFTKVRGLDRPQIVHLKNDGTVTDRILTSSDGALTALMVQEDGKLVVGGSFSKLDGLDRYMIGRIATVETAAQSLVYDNDAKTLTWTRGGGLPQLEYATFDFSTNGSEWYALGSAPALDGKVQLTGMGLPSNVSFVYFRSRGLVRTAPHGSQGWVTLASTSYIGALPSLPTSNTLVVGNGALPDLAVPALATNLVLNITGLPPGISYDAATNKFVGAATKTGTYVVTWMITDGFVTRTYQQTWIVVNTSGTYTVDPKARLMNISARMDLSGTAVGTGGFVIDGSASKKVLIRAVGPTLGSFGLTNVMSKPRLRLMNSAQVQINSATAWDSSAAMSAEFNRLGAFGLTNGSADSVLEVTLAPGAYTCQVDDLDAVGGTVLLELYDASVDPTAEAQRFLNLSAQAPVTGLSHVLVGGLVIGGADNQRILIRAPGPSLAAYSVATPLTNPTISVYDSTNTLIAKNDDWGLQMLVSSAYQPAAVADVVAAQATAGAFSFADKSLDSALLLTLPHGQYTVVVSSADGVSAGSTMIEIYQMQK